jgi:tripartite-type tricarboxylate transporter receptor subunit TctC
MGVLRPAISCIGVAAALIAAASTTGAEDFPTRPVKIIVQARLVTEQLAKIWGQQPIILNQAGAGGLIASRALAASEPDGYTLFMAGGSVFVVLPEVQKNLPFDVNQFVPIGFVAEQYYGLFASSKLPVKSTAELVAYSRQQPDGLNAVAGTRGGLQHLTVEWFRNRSGAKLNMIHYPGTAQAMNDVITARVPVMMQTLLPVAGAIAAGEVRLLAMTSPARLPSHPDVPTVAETVPGFASSGWSILVARPELTKKLEEMGNYSRPMNPRELADFVRDERQLWGPIVRQVGPAPQ